MAIRVLLDHHVLEENIYFANILSTHQGLHWIQKAFPKVKVIACFSEDITEEEGLFISTIGDFGDRYFGTD